MIRGEEILLRKIVVEVLPKYSSENCCSVDGEETTIDCCNPLVEANELKDKIKNVLGDLVVIHVFDYTLSVDWSLAVNRLRQLFKERGFRGLSEMDNILEVVTPVVIVNGNLVSFVCPFDFEKIVSRIMTMSYE